MFIQIFLYNERRFLSILKRIIKEFIFFIIFLLINSFITFKLFYPIFTAKEVIITYGIHPFDICSKNPDLWKILKISYLLSF